jgi:hypothetical protein
MVGVGGLGLAIARAIAAGHGEGDQAAIVEFLVTAWARRRKIAILICWIVMLAEPDA